MTIYFASDHAGFELKNILLPYVRDVLGCDVEDCGAVVYDENDDYPNFIRKAAETVSQKPTTAKAIIIGGSGQGEAIVANRFAHVRAVVFNGQYGPEGREIPDEIILSREHNDANILSLGARFLTPEEAKSSVALWLETEFSGTERHTRRIAQIERMDTAPKCSRIIPAVIPTTFTDLEEILCGTFRHLTRNVQVDIVDGVYVPSRSWPYTDQGAVHDLQRYSDQFDIEVDLMITEPEKHFYEYVAAGVKRVVIHAESTTHLEDILDSPDRKKVAIGLSIENSTPVSELTKYIDQVDFVQVMGIAKIGFQGQSFDIAVLDRIKELRSQYPALEISVDGSVNRDTLPQLIAAGADRFIAGSAILKANNPTEVFREYELMAATLD